MSKKKVKVSKASEAPEAVEVVGGIGAEGPKKNPAEKVPPAPTIPSKDAFNKGFIEGFDSGYGRGFHAGKEAPYEVAFLAGVRHIVALAEQKMLWEFGSPGVRDRESLIKTGKMPIWWIMTLVTNFIDSGGARGEAPSREQPEESEKGWKGQHARRE